MEAALMRAEPALRPTGAASGLFRAQRLANGPGRSAEQFGGKGSG
jgi:hypothetical protein